MERSSLSNSEDKLYSEHYQTLSCMADIQMQDSLPSKPFLTADQLHKIQILSQELKRREHELSSIQTELMTIDNCKEQHHNLKSQLDLANQKIYYYQDTIHKLDKDYEELRRKHAIVLDEMNKKETRPNEIDDEFNSLNSSIKKLTDSHLSLKNRLEQANQFKEDSQKLTFIKSLKSENESLRTQLQNALSSLAQCSVEIRILPKLRHELKEATYLIIEASKELEKEKTEKLEIMTQYSALTEICEQSDPIEFIHYLKMKYSTDISFLQHKVLDLQKEEKEMHEFQDIIKELLANISYFCRGNFLYDELNLVVPDKVEHLRPAFEILKEEIYKLQADLRQKFETQEHERSYLASKVAKYQENTSQLHVKLEQVSLNIHNQEDLYKQLANNKKSLQQDLHKSTKNCHSLTQINEELQRDNLAFKLEFSKAVSLLNKMISELSSEKCIETDLITSIESLYKLYRPFNTDSEIQRLRNELSLSESSRLKEKVQFNKCIQEMDIKISKFSQAMEESERNLSEMLAKYHSNQKEMENLTNEMLYLKERNSELEKIVCSVDVYKDTGLHSVSTQDENTYKRCGDYPLEYPSLKVLDGNCGDSLTSEVTELRDLLNMMKKDYLLLKDNLQTSLEINSKSREILRKKDEEIQILQRENANLAGLYGSPDDLTYSTDLRESESFRYQDSVVRESNPLKSSSAFIPLS